jgi:hypothetical protein
MALDITRDTPLGKDETIIHLAWHDKAKGTRGIDKYTVRYAAVLHEHRWQTGEEAVWSFGHVHPIDDRACHQELSGSITRTVYFDNERRSDSLLENKFGKVEPVSIHGEGSGPGINNFFRAQNCNDMEGEFNNNVSAASAKMNEALPHFVTKDRANLIAELIRDYSIEVSEKK